LSAKYFFPLHLDIYDRSANDAFFEGCFDAEKKPKYLTMCWTYSIDVALTHVRKKASHFEDDRCSNENMIATAPSRWWCCCCCCCRRTSAVGPWNWEWWCSAALIHPTSLKEIHRWTLLKIQRYKGRVLDMFFSNFGLEGFAKKQKNFYSISF